MRTSDEFTPAMAFPPDEYLSIQARHPGLLQSNLVGGDDHRQRERLQVILVNHHEIIFRLAIFNSYLVIYGIMETLRILIIGINVDETMPKTSPEWEWFIETIYGADWGTVYGIDLPT